MRALLALLLLAIPAAAQFTDSHSIWKRPVTNAAPADGGVLVWSASQGKFVFSSDPAFSGNVTIEPTLLTPSGLITPGFPTLALRGWDAAIGKFQQTGSGQATIAWIGDSWSTNELVNLPVRTALQTKYGNAGVGFVPLDGFSPAPTGATLARAGTWTDSGQVSGAFGLQGMSSVSSDTSTPAKYTITATTTTPVIHYLARTGGGTFSFQSDSGATYAIPTTIAALNLSANSQSFGNAGWTKANATVPTTNNAAPDGSSTAAYLQEDNTSNQHYVSQGVTAAANTPYTQSMYVRSTTRPYLIFTSGYAGTFGDVVFYLTTGTVAFKDASYTSATIISCAIAGVCGTGFPAAPGWYRVSVTFTNTSGGNINDYWKLSITGSGDSGTYLGDAASGSYLWGAQTNIGSVATQYVSTTAAPAGPIYASVTFDGLTNASHAVKLTVTAAGSTGVTPLGVEMNINVPGVRVHRIPSSGATISTFLQANSAVWTGGIAVLNPPLVVISLGVNELLANMDPATQAAGYSTLVAQIHAAVPTAEILLVPPADVGAVGTYTMAQYAAAQRTAAIANGWGYIDTVTLFGPYAASSARSLWTNTTHVNAYGGQVIANHVLSLFRRGL